jgi:2-keto-4-pentenoate hydratase/2-oxohepta-3-ene-1,7-dioic acid hydratase in catechol pathway
LGVIQGDGLIDISDVAGGEMLRLVEGGSALLERVQAATRDRRPSSTLAEARLLAPFPRPPKNILCLGLNYREHVAEGARATSGNIRLPDYPVWFTKAVTSVCGPYEDICIDPAVSTQYDWEVELAVVIGREGRHIPRERALEYVHSYTVFNDFSVRDVQMRHGGQWFKGKSLDRSSPMGPWLVTPDELGDPASLTVTCRVNGVEKQRSNTSLMIFDIPTAIADISQVLTLEPGDVIATGTPSGVGFARTPPEFLRAGDVLETEIERIGVLRNRIVEP